MREAVITYHEILKIAKSDKTQDGEYVLVSVQGVDDIHYIRVDDIKTDKEFADRLVAKLKHTNNTKPVKFNHLIGTDIEVEY